MDLKKNFIDKTDSTLFQFIRYFFVGGFAFVVDFGFLYVLTEYAHLHYLASASIAFLSGLLVNYGLSKIWVFSESVTKNKWIEFLVFALIGIIGLVLTNLFLWILTDCFSVYYMFSKIVTTAIIYFWNFFARKYILFNPKT